MKLFQTDPACGPTHDLRVLQMLAHPQAYCWPLVGLPLQEVCTCMSGCLHDVIQIPLLHYTLIYYIQCIARVLTM